MMYRLSYCWRTRISVIFLDYVSCSFIELCVNAGLGCHRTNSANWLKICDISD